MTFQRIQTLRELDDALAKNPHKLALLDLYADWCVACKEFETKTFTDANVQTAFKNVLLLQVDMTKNSDENKAIMARYQVLGLPTLLFLDQTGNEIAGSRITGFMDALSFLNQMNELTTNH